MVQKVGRHLLIVDLGSRTGVYHNGERRAAAWIAADDEVRIGPYRIRRAAEADPEGLPEDAGPTASTTANDSYWVRVLNGTGASGRSELSLRRPVTLVGRSNACKVRLADASVSGIHASLSRCAEGILAVDLFGRGGMLVNGRRVRRSFLEPGDQIGVGRYVLELVERSRALGPPGDVIADERSGPPALLVPSAKSGRVDVTVHVASPAPADLTSSFAVIQRMLDEQSKRQTDALAGLIESMRLTLKEEICREIRDEIRDEFSRLREISEEILRLQRALPRPTPEGESASPPPESGAPTPGPSRRPRTGSAPPDASGTPPDYGWVTSRLRELEAERAGRWGRLARLIGRDS